MSDISTILQNILSAIYGKDVRQAIHDGIELCYTDATQTDTTLTQSGRSADSKTVGDRFDDLESQIPVVDQVPTENSTNAVQSGGVKSALDTLQAQIPQIDSTLSQSGQAADAKETGDRIERTNEVLGCGVAFTETLGYINTSGGIGSPSSYGREVYTDEYIPVTVGDTLRFYMYSTSNAYVMWSKLALYDINKTFIRRIDIASGTHTDITNYWTNTDNNVAYVRYTYRTGTTAAGQWVYSNIDRMTGDDITAHVAFNKAYTANNRYINTNVTIGDIVSFTPVVFSRFAYAIIPCNAGDTFTITGRGAGAARLWAFVDENKTLISKSIGNAFALNEIITAPTNSAYLIVNFDMLTEYSCYKGVNVSVTNDVRTAVIQQGVVHDLPSNVAMPTVDFYATVQDSSAAGAKPAIYNNGEWFVITYGENLDGTGTDIPKVTESGVLAMKYKKFRLVNGVESDVSYGTIAQKGTTYTDYQGNTATSVGGWGLPSGVGNMQYFTNAYTGNYSYNGEAHYGMTPCCCSVNIANDGTVTFGTIKELTLDIDGTVGKFDVTRLSAENNSYLLYMTTAAPYYSTLGYKWMIPVIGGIAYFTSDNGIDWTYQWTIETPYQPQCEVMCVSESGGDIVFAARTQTRNSTTSDTLYIGKVSQAGTPSANYKLPFSASRAFLIRNQNDILLFYTPASKNANECIRIIIENGSNLYFWRWFTIWHKATWYLTCYNSVFPERFSKMYLCGGNGEVGSTAGMTFIALSFDTTSPRRPNEIPFAIT